MTFTQSVVTCLMKYADFKGRASRSEYWWWALFYTLVSVVTGLVSETASAIFTLAILLPSLAVGARRLHDTDRSGWYQLLGLIPLIGWIILIVLYVQEGIQPNRFGPAPETT